MKWQFKSGILLTALAFAGNQAKAQVQDIISATDTSIYQTENFNSTTTPDSSRTVLSPVVTKPILIRPKKPTPISKELSGGIRRNTDGWSLFMEKGYVLSNDSRNSDKFYNIRLFSVELSEHKHAKEKREANAHHGMVGPDKPKPLIYGKVNNFYALKLGYGFRKMIAGKPDPGTVSIHWVYSGGLSVGLLKPYYVDAYVPSQDNPGFLDKKTIKYSEETKGDFLRQQYIIGGSGWTKGLDEIQFAPGLHVRTALHFDFAASAKTKMALEVGVNAELYTRKIELLALQEAKAYLLSAYVSFQFGKRY